MFVYKSLIYRKKRNVSLEAVLRILIRMFLSLPDPVAYVKSTDPDPSIIKQKE